MELIHDYFSGLSQAYAPLMSSGDPRCFCNLSLDPDGVMGVPQLSDHH